MAIESIAKTLGTGSGIDITSLVDQLVEAQFANKNAALTKRDETLTAQISSTSELKSMITGFDTALKSLISSGNLKTQPTSSNSGVVKVSSLPGATVTSLSASVEVRQLAAAQTAASAPVTDTIVSNGTGTLTLTFGTATVENGAMTEFTAGSAASMDIAITAGHSGLNGIRDAINAANAGVTASILTDDSGSRLVLKSVSGASRAFTLTATEDAGSPGLSALNIGVGATGTTIGSAAQDAIVAVDGIAVKRATNAVSDLIPGVRLDLVSASPGTSVTLGTQPPVDALAQAVNDVVETYNQLFAVLQTATDPVSGPLKSDPAARALRNSLRGLTLQQLVSGAAAGTPDTLSRIGVATNRDGTLTVNSSELTSALLTSPDAVAAMFKSGSGLSAALSTISAAATNLTYGLGASEANYTKAKTDIALDQEKATTAAEAVRTRMTRQFAGMDAIVASYKSTQTFLDNQIAAWNKND